MATTFTPNYNLAKPDRLVDLMDPSDHLNPNYDLIDSALKGLSNQAANLTDINYQVVSADLTETTSSFLNIPEFSINFDGGDELLFFATLIVGGSNVMDVEVAITGGTVYPGAMARDTITTGSAGGSIFLRGETGSNSGSTATADLNSTDTQISIWGYVVGTTVGSVNFSFNQSGFSANAIVRAGSFIEVVHVP